MSVCRKEEEEGRREERLFSTTASAETVGEEELVCDDGSGASVHRLLCDDACTVIHPAASRSLVLISHTYALDQQREGDRNLFFLGRVPPSKLIPPHLSRVLVGSRFTPEFPYCFDKYKDGPVSPYLCRSCICFSALLRDRSPSPPPLSLSLSHGLSLSQRKGAFASCAVCVPVGAKS